MKLLKVKLESHSFPKLLADLSHSNQFLKVFSIACLLVTAGMTVLVTLAFSRKPIVIALTPKGSQLQATQMPEPEVEIREAVRAYVAIRYNWDKDSVERSLDSAKGYIAPQFTQNFVQAVSNVKKFSKEKNVAQRAYVTALAVDLKKNVVTISGDRISEVQGIRAVGPLNISFSFQSGPRTPDNPWGVYISKETEL